MRHVSQQISLRGNQRFDLFGHEIEIAPQRANLVITTTNARSDSRFQPAGSNFTCGRSQTDDRLGDVAGEQKTKQGAEQTNAE